ncbi:MAG: hypothetical protein QMC61_05980 [Candidatus Poseidoniaceae archaeon]
MNDTEHYDIAKSRWLEHVAKCAEELGVDYDERERGYASESFDECEQLKWINHCQTLKVKWEHRCWWADCKTPTFFGEYYSILCHMPEWELPHDLAKKGKL